LYQRRDDILSLGLVTATTVNVTARIDGRLASLNDLEGQPVRAGQVIALITPGGSASAQRPLTVRAPISGLAGLRKVDPGNFVHAGDTLLTIAKLQPIAVVFSISEEALPRVQALLRSGTAPIVEVRDRAGGSVVLATGRVTALDNQIDTSSGTIKLKAIIDNKNETLFPNQFVNVRLLSKSYPDTGR
jgi:multidrug efflux pump subunit AcrA (membrane-fusion protein)